MADDVLAVLRRSVFRALKAANANTRESYPPAIFDDHAGITLPLTVYAAELGTGATMAMRHERRIEVEVTVDHFAESRGALETIASNARAAMLAVVPQCTMDRYSTLMNGLTRRSQAFRGVIDTQTGIVYTR